MASSSDIDAAIDAAALQPASVNITPAATSVTNHNLKDLIEVAKHKKAEEALQDDCGWPLRTVLINPPGAGGY